MCIKICIYIHINPVCTNVFIIYKIKYVAYVLIITEKRYSILSEDCSIICKGVGEGKEQKILFSS